MPDETKVPPAKSDDDAKTPEEFIEVKGGQIRRVAGSILRSRGCIDPTGHTDEVAQDICVKLLQSWDTLRSADDALNTITANTASSHARTCRRERADDNQDDTVTPCFTPTSPIYADPRTFYEHVQLLEQLLTRLDPIDHKIFELHWFYGFTFDEVAIILDLPSGTVRSRHSRAMDKLN
jgi:RNA polymerase sigma factor (sigma-70 family)